MDDRVVLLAEERGVLARALQLERRALAQRLLRQRARLQLRPARLERRAPAERRARKEPAHRGVLRRLVAAERRQQRAERLALAVGERGPYFGREERGARVVEREVK